MAPRTTSAGGVAPVPIVKPRDPLSKLSNAAAAKAGKVTEKKKKADGSSRRPRKKLAGHVTEAPASSLVAPAANAHKVYDEMPTSFNDETYMSTMGVGSNNSHWSQTNDEFEGDEDGGGIFDASKGRAGNYTTDEDKLICNTWLKGSRDAIVGGGEEEDEDETSDEEEESGEEEDGDKDAA